MNNNLLIDMQDETDSEFESDISDYDSLHEENIYNENGEINYENLTIDKIYLIIEWDPIFKKLTRGERDMVGIYFFMNNFLDYDQIQIIKNNIYIDRCYNSKLLELEDINELLLLRDDELFFPQFMKETDSLLSVKKNNFQLTVNNLKNKTQTRNKYFLNKILNTSRENKFKNESNHDISFIQQLPDEILETILCYSFDFHLMHITPFLNIKLVCKKFYRIMNTGFFIDKVLVNINPDFKLHFYEKFYNIDRLSFRIYNKIIYFYINNMFKNYIVQLYNIQLLDALGGFSNFMSLNTIVLPSECLDNLCGNECCYRYHNIFNEVNSPITRGIDTEGRGFLLFLYKNVDSDHIHYEIIYNNSKPTSKNITFSGLNNTSYIGHKCANYKDYNFNMYRSLDYRSFDYIKRLVNNKLCGEVHLNNELVGIENYTKSVKLCYSKEKLKQSILKNLENL